MYRRLPESSPKFVRVIRGAAHAAHVYALERGRASARRIADDGHQRAQRHAADVLHRHRTGLRFLRTGILHDVPVPNSPRVSPPSMTSEATRLRRDFLVNDLQRDALVKPPIAHLPSASYTVSHAPAAIFRSRRNWPRSSIRAHCVIMRRLSASAYGACGPATAHQNTALFLAATG